MLIKEKLNSNYPNYSSIPHNISLIQLHFFGQTEELRHSNVSESRFAFIQTSK